MLNRRILSIGDANERSALRRRGSHLLPAGTFRPTARNCAAAMMDDRRQRIDRTALGPGTIASSMSINRCRSAAADALTSAGVDHLGGGGRRRCDRGAADRPGRWRPLPRRYPRQELMRQPEIVLDTAEVRQSIPRRSNSNNDPFRHQRKRSSARKKSPISTASAASWQEDRRRPPPRRCS